MENENKIIKVSPTAHKAAKIKAAEKGTTVKDYVSDLIEADSKKKKKKTDEKEEENE